MSAEVPRYTMALLPDQETIVRAQELANICYPDAEYCVNKFPHITLFQARINWRGVPDGLIVDIQRYVKDMFQRTCMTLGDIQIFGDTFLFWNVDYHPEKNAALHAAHERATRELAMFVDPKSKKDPNSIPSMNLSSQQAVYLEEYGSPFVFDEYVPHITLAHDPDGFHGSLQNGKAQHEMSVQAVVLAQVGIHGEVVDIVSRV